MVEKSHTSGFWPSIADPLKAVGSRIAEWVAPPSEASANTDKYTIAVELPGVAEKDIDVSVHDGVLSLKGEKRTSRSEEGDTWFFCERQYGAFSRSFRLPPDADGDGIGAELKDGVLTVTVPKKSAAEHKPQSIAIRKG